MGRVIDVDDLVDAGEVAEMCGLASRKVVAANRSKGVGAWSTFPDPVIERGPCHFWLRSEVEAWDAERKRKPAREGEPGGRR
jgi:hypothetical protein